MISIGIKSVAYLNLLGRQQLSNLSPEEFYALPEEEKKKFPAHVRHLLEGRGLSIVALHSNEQHRYEIVLRHDDTQYELPYEYVSAIFLP